MNADNALNKKISLTVLYPCIHGNGIVCKGVMRFPVSLVIETVTSKGVASWPIKMLASCAPLLPKMKLDMPTKFGPAAAEKRLPVPGRRCASQLRKFAALFQERRVEKQI